MNREHTSYWQRLGLFGWNTVLPAAPAALWWTLSVAVFSIVSLIFEKELWPHTPQAEEGLLVLLAACLCIMPWLLGRTTARVAQRLTSWWWQALCHWVAIVCYLAAGLLLVLFILLGYIFMFAKIGAD